ncbi:2OG-Fe(II) oxygenase [Magnetofaba australis]|uniref:Putative prolyl 4-hydroxylase subunit alpha n=1 Tax=Magnetofaba australis IT-1 TaxID=1434232 RepID=A0A1Y2K5B1_9PROT|nr:2OG-Fe(II) oxygenase [Magnetofaba australis]OSM02185.1 putative prolyl 4-hydroxylase subunit alpha [Magnetofaba australis IT-1]
MTPEVIHAESQSFALRNLFSAEECRHIIARGDAAGYDKALIQTGRGEVYSDEVRNNDRVIFEDTELAQTLYARVRPFLPPQIYIYRPVGLNDHFRLLRYTGAQYFKWHQDGHFRKSPSEVSMLTLLIYLNDDFAGGETEFEDFRVVAEAGMGVVFRHELRHQGRTLRQGTKYALRTDVMYASDLSLMNQEM